MTGTTLDFDKLAGPFLIFISGVVLALLLVISEKVMASLQQNDKVEKLNLEEEITRDDPNTETKRIEPCNDGLFELPYENKYEIYSKWDLDRMILLLKREKENNASEPFACISDSDASKSLKGDLNELTVVELS